jgi:hypothetical protein
MIAPGSESSRQLQCVLILDSPPAASLWLRQQLHADRTPMKFTDQLGVPTDRSSSVGRKTGAILTDSHFLIPLTVFCIGLALLITLH